MTFKPYNEGDLKPSYMKIKPPMSVEEELASCKKRCKSFSNQLIRVMGELNSLKKRGKND